MEITLKNMDKSTYTKPQKLKQVSNHVLMCKLHTDTKTESQNSQRDYILLLWLPTSK